MMIGEFKAYLLAEVAALRARQPDSAAFATATEIIDVLAQASTSSGGHRRQKGNRDRFLGFVRHNMRPQYNSFRYASGEQDLPEQMYAILRCGLVHARSLSPDPQRAGRSSAGRTNSIFISADGAHLASVTDGSRDAALFVFEPFVADIEAALRGVFLRASRETGLLALIENHLRNQSPVRGLVAPLSYNDPAARAGTAVAYFASGVV